jgi:hypothetical protein
VLFHYLNKHEHLKNQLDMQFHIFYTQCSLLHAVLMLFGLLYNRPMEPFLKRRMGMLVHIVYIRYKCHKPLHCET